MMSNLDSNGVVNATASAVSLFAADHSPENWYNELFLNNGRVREHWQPIVSAFDKRGREDLWQHQEKASRMRHEDGATINPFADATKRATLWAQDIIPLLVPEREWAVIEEGVIQRAHLLDKVLADIYGPQELLKNGSIPAELVFANPHFLHACHGIQPSGNRYLTFYAVDLYRDADGRFRVFRDYGSNPAGLGYALENRIVMSRIFSGLYHQAQVQRLAPFFQSFHRALIQRASLKREDPGIVLFSPGPDNHIYYEHALLSRYLGYPLVEGQDLTVRNGKVYLKKLAGLEPVEAIFRHIPDLNSDPFALRRETASGVAGLIQVCREQNIDIVNPLGCGFIDTPVLKTVLPSLCRQLLRSDLYLDSHPSWWCGTSEGLCYAMDHLENLVVRSAMDPARNYTEPKEIVGDIRQNPGQYLVDGPLTASLSPVWEGGGVRFRQTLLRIFACATEHGFAVMPGGLAITAGDAGKLHADNPEQQQSKDLWVLAGKPVEPFTLMENFHVITDFKRSNDLPSRVADNLLWLGRYLERAEGLIRLLQAVYRRLSGEDRSTDNLGLQFLLNILQARNFTPKNLTIDGDGRFSQPLQQQLHDVLYRPDLPVSVLSILQRVQQTARNVRDRLSLDSFRVISRLEDFVENNGSDPLEMLDKTLFTLSAFSGLAMESMTRGLGWRFMDMGRRVERAINQAVLIRLCLPLVGNDVRSTLQTLLEVSDSMMTYRARYRSTFQLAPVLDLLLADESNPKSLAFQFSRLAQHVENLPRQSERRYVCPEERTALQMLTTVRLLDLNAIKFDEVQDTTLPTFLSSMESLLKEFAQQISGHYLSRVPATPHYTVLAGDRA